MAQQIKEVIKGPFRLILIGKETTHLIYCTSCETPLMHAPEYPFGGGPRRIVAMGVFFDHTQAYELPHMVDLIDLRKGSSLSLNKFFEGISY